MTLGLDLSSTRAKLERAAEHFRVLNGEIPLSIQASKPYSLVREFNEDTGWLSIKIRPEPVDIRFSVVLGEFLHDLRSALDHIVSALVLKSNATLTAQHQFPIHRSETAFDNHDGTAAQPTGCLLGMRHGFDEIRSFQPFLVQPDPEQSSLALIRRLSNSDKHRAIVGFNPIPQSHNLRVAHNGRVIESWQPPNPIVWEPHEEVEFQRIRFRARANRAQLDAFGSVARS